MPVYANAGGRSGIVFYEEPDPDSVIVHFRSGGGYLYDYDSCGNDVYTLKRLLDRGSGAHAFINESIGKNYARKV